MLDFPPYDALCCNYIEYSSMLELKDHANEVLENLKIKCAPEQLDKRLWDHYKKPHGTIEFCASIAGGGLEILARCHGTALKKRITDTTLQRTVGLIPGAAVNPATEDKILNWLYKKYHIVN